MKSDKLDFNKIAKLLFCRRLLKNEKAIHRPVGKSLQLGISGKKKKNCIQNIKYNSKLNRKQINWGKKAGELNRYFTDEDILMPYKEMKRCPT